MKFVSLEKSRAGWQPDDDVPKKAVAKPAPRTSAEPATNSTNPDGGTPAANSQEG